MRVNNLAGKRHAIFFSCHVVIPTSKPTGRQAFPVVPQRHPQYLTHVHSQASNTMPTITLDGTSTQVRVDLSTELSLDQLQKFPAFRTWLSSLTKSLQQQQQTCHPFHRLPYTLRSIKVQAVDFFGGKRLGFVKLKAEISNDNGDTLPGSVFLRGGSVAMLLILHADSSSEEYVILAIQPRIAAGSLSFVELPAGMLDDSGTFTGAAAKEIKEETGLDIEEKDLVDMTELVFKDRTQEQSSDEPHLQRGIYPSPGGCDEFIPIFMTRKRMSADKIEALKGKLTGLREHGEKITLKICRLDELWKVGARDGKTLSAVSLYEGLSREGKI
jgi:ADP-sugar diphosphatase